MHDIVNEDVARAFRIHASERGFDYRRCTMVAFGGSGPVQALAVAVKLGIPRAVFPVGAGVMSALGLLASPLAFEVVQAGRTLVEELDPWDFCGKILSAARSGDGTPDISRSPVPPDHGRASAGYAIPRPRL